MKFKHNIYTNMLDEALQFKINTDNNTAITLSDLKDFLTEIAPDNNAKNRIKVRALQFHTNTDIPEAKYVRYEFRFEIGHDNVSFMIKNTSYRNTEPTISDFLNDLDAILIADWAHRNNITDNNAIHQLTINDLTGDIDALSYHIKITDENLDNTTNVYFIYEDRSDILFIIPALINVPAMWSWTSVKNWITNVCNVNHIIAGNYNLNLQVLHNTIQTFLDNPDEYGYDTTGFGTDTVAKMFKSIAPLNYLQTHQLDTGLNNIINNHNIDNNQNNQNNNNDATDIDDNTDTDAVNNDNEVDAAHNTENNNDDTATDNDTETNNNATDNNPETTDNTTENTENGENINGLIIEGEWNGVTQIDAQTQIFNENKRLILSPLTFEQFKQHIRSLPADVISRISDTPVLFKQIQSGSPTGRRNNKGRLNDLYDQVYKNYLFWYIFNSRTNVTWFRLNRKSKLIQNKQSLRNDLLGRMLTMSGNDWLPAFYNDTAGSRFNQSIITIWSSDNSISTDTNNTTDNTNTTNTDSNNNADAQKEAIFNHVFNNIVYPALSPYRLASNVVVVNPVTDINMIYPREIRKKIISLNINSKDQDLIPGNVRNRKKISAAQLKIFIAFVLAGGTYRYLGRNNYILEVFNNINANITTYLNDSIPPQQNIKPKLSTDDANKLTNVQNAINAAISKSKKYGLDIQVTVPGHKPAYNFIPGLFGQQQGKNWPNDNKRYFVVMFPGVSTEKYFDEQALNFLSKFNDISAIINTAFKEAAKVYDDMSLAVILDNGLPAIYMR